MKPRYYVHMTPKTVENVSCMWKAAHITVFFLLVISSSIATVCIYNILDMYSFNCIAFAKVSFEQTYEERLKAVKTEGKILELDANITDETELQLRNLEPDCAENPDAPECANKTEDSRGRNQPRIPQHVGHSINQSMSRRSGNNTGFLNMRKTIFSTLYTCDLMLFAPLSSIIVAIFLGALVAVGGKGGAGNPGDLLPNPWICVYPFVALCGFMVTFCFISNHIFHQGLAAFCLMYLPITQVKWCSEKMDVFNVQFAPDHTDPPKPFYMNYFVGGIAAQITSALWVVQVLLYVLRILCLADFSIYLTRIRLKSDEGRPEHKMANVVYNVLDIKTKVT